MKYYPILNDEYQREKEIEKKRLEESIRKRKEQPFRLGSP